MKQFNQPIFNHYVVNHFIKLRFYYILAAKFEKQFKIY